MTEPCAQCGAALAHDQRYCLECGAPRTYLSGLHQLDGLRMGAGASPAAYNQFAVAGSPYRAAPAPYGSAAYPYPPAGQPPLGGSPTGSGGSSRGGGAAGLIAGVGVLLLAMGVGVLIGRSGANAGKAAAPGPAQVITVDQGGAGTGTETGASQAPAPDVKHGSQKSPSKAGSSTGGSKQGNGGGVGESIAKPAPPAVLKNEKSKSGGSFEQKSKNLPNVISTG